MSRADAESELEFIGFIIFENKLKPTSKGVITELHEAGIRSVMCTGDNILTAVSVARECGFVEGAAPCFVPYFVEGKLSFRIILKILCTNETHKGVPRTQTPVFAGRALITPIIILMRIH